MSGRRELKFDPEKFQLPLARLKKGGESFEVTIEPDKAIAYKEGRDVEIGQVITSQDIFADAQKGLLASQTKLESTFQTTDALVIAKAILDSGLIQLGAEFKRTVRENKRKRILELIHKNGVDPRTDTPHPLSRIESAMEQAKVKIDEYTRPSNQLKTILRQLQPIIPIRFEKKEIQITFTPQYAHKAYGVLQKYGAVSKTQWLADGSFIGVIEIPAGLEQELYDALNSATHGTVQATVLTIKKY
ncbi:MAG: ribosome assembly factor SBDS [Candidatus Woesearchaeota archaeon]